MPNPDSQTHQTATGSVDDVGAKLNRIEQEMPPAISGRSLGEITARNPALLLGGLAAVAALLSGLPSGQVSPSENRKDQNGQELKPKANEIYPSNDAGLAVLLATPDWFNHATVPTAEQLSGKLLLIDFWGTFCGPCIAKIPELNLLQQEFGAQGLVIIGVSPESTETVARMAGRMEYLVAAQGTAIVSQRAVTNFPTVELWDSNGTILFSATAPESARLRAAIEDQLSSNLFRPGAVVIKRGTGTGEAARIIDQHKQRPPSVAHLSLEALQLRASPYLQNSANLTATTCEEFSHFYRGNLPNDTWSGDTVVRSEAISMLGGLSRRGSATVQQRGMELLVELLIAGEPSELVRYQLVSELAGIGRNLEDRSHRSTLRELLIPLLPTEKDLKTRALLSVLVERLAEPALGNVPPTPSLMLELRAQLSAPSEAEVAVLTNSLRMQLADGAFTEQQVSKLIEFGFSEVLVAPDGSVNRDALRQRDIFLSLVELISPKRSESEAVKALQQTVAEALLSEGRADWLYQSLLLQRLQLLGVESLPERYLLLLKEELLLLESNKDLTLVARTVRFAIETQ